MQFETSDGHSSGTMKQTAGFTGLEFTREDKTQNKNWKLLKTKLKIYKFAWKTRDFAMIILSNLIFIS